VTDVSLFDEVNASACRDCGNRYTVKRDVAALPDRYAPRVRALCTVCGRMLTAYASRAPDGSVPIFNWCEEPDPSCELSWADWIRRFDAGYSDHLSHEQVQHALDVEILLEWWRAGVTPELARVRWELTRNPVDVAAAVDAWRTLNLNDYLNSYAWLGRASSSKGLDEVDWYVYGVRITQDGGQRAEKDS
jgi:hypothetical protein